MDASLGEVVEKMLQRPKSPLRATYHGPKGVERVEASVIHDGHRAGDRQVCGMSRTTAIRRRTFFWYAS